MTTRAKEIRELGNTTLLELDSNGNVGIGTALPVHTLDVQSSIAVPLRLRTTNTAGTGLYLDNDRTGSKTFGILSGNVGAGYFNIKDEDAGVNRLVIDPYGSIGIGTESPATALHMYAAMSNELTFKMQQQEGSFEIGTNGDNTIFRNSVGPILYINETGRIGIGTINPQNKLHVEGTSSDSLIIMNSTAAPTNLESLPPALEFIGRGWNTNHGSREIRGKIEYFADYGDYGSGATQGGLRFSTEGAGGNSTAPDSLQLGMTLAAGSDSQPYPRLGIGMTSPAAKLHVRTTTVAAGSDLDEIAIIADTPFISGYQAQSVSLLSGFDSTIHGTAIGMAYENPGYALTFFTNDNTSGLPTERLRINDNGNVGINTTTPRARLDVSGNMIVGDRYDQGNLESEWPASGSQLHVSRIGYPDAEGVLVADGNEANIIVSTGPSNTAGGGSQGWLGSLWFGSSDSPLVAEQFNWKVAGVRSYSSRDTAAGNVSSGNLSFWTTDNTTSAAERMTINYNGNVGIGSTNPNTLLDINATSGGNGGPGTTSMSGMSVGSGFVAFRNNGSVFNEVIRGESNCMGIYNYNYNDGVLIYTNNANSSATPSFHPAYHFGGYNNADQETFGRGWAQGDPIFTMARPSTKYTGSGYGARGVSNSGQFTSIVKTATKTEFRDNQGQHYFDGTVVVKNNLSAEADPGFWYRKDAGANQGNTYRALICNDGQIIMRAYTDYNHKMWYYDGVNIGTNQSHGHFRVWGENNTSRGATDGGNTLRFSVDTPNGNIGVTEGGSQIYSGSDERLKTNVVDLPNQLEKIKQLRPVSYDWKYTSDEEYIYGFIAQEVQAVDDTVVYDMGTTTYRNDKQYGEDLEPDGTIENTLAIYERQLIPMMVKAMQEMSDKIDSLQARLDDAGL